MSTSGYLTDIHPDRVNSNGVREAIAQYYLIRRDLQLCRLAGVRSAFGLGRSVNLFAQGKLSA